MEFKLDLGIVEIKLPISIPAKKWWRNQRSHTLMRAALKRAEDNYLVIHPDHVMVQITKMIFLCPRTRSFAAPSSA
jgi:hypothetical protein